MSKKILKRVAIGVLLYAGFAFAVVVFYPDKPANMGWEDREVFNKVQIDKLKPGPSHAEIINLLGSPDISEAKKVDGKTLQVMYYRTHRVKADGITSQDECTPLLFKDEKLVALGEKAETQYTYEQ